MKKVDFVSIECRKLLCVSPIQVIFSPGSDIAFYTLKLRAFTVVGFRDGIKIMPIINKKYCKRAVECLKGLSSAFILEIMNFL